MTVLPINVLVLWYYWTVNRLLSVEQCRAAITSPVLRSQFDCEYGWDYCMQLYSCCSWVERWRLTPRIYWSHTRMVVRECLIGDEAIRPLARPKSHNRSSPQIGMLDYVLYVTRHTKLGSDRFRGFRSPNTRFCRAFWCDLHVRCLGSSVRPYTLKRIFSFLVAKNCFNMKCSYINYS